jgi:hypothetical protein
MAMQKIYRIMIVIIVVLIFVILALDYIGFHGSILLNPAGAGAVVGIIDSTTQLFLGPNSFTNFMFFAVIAIGLLVGVLAIAYKFIKG